MRLAMVKANSPCFGWAGPSPITRPCWWNIMDVVQIRSDLLPLPISRTSRSMLHTFVPVCFPISLCCPSCSSVSFSLSPLPAQDDPFAAGVRTTPWLSPADEQKAVQAAAGV